MVIFINNMSKKGIYCSDLIIGNNYYRIENDIIIDIGRLIERNQVSTGGNCRNGFTYNEKIIFEKLEYEFKSLSGNSDLLPFVNKLKLNK